MSGGSMNYLYSKIEYDARFTLNTPERRAFKKHLELVCAALRKIEWNDSGDGADDEEGAIRACIGPQRLLASEVEYAEKTMADLAKLIAAARATL